MTGAELDALDDAALAGTLPDITVFARVTPAHKVRIVTALRSAGRTVAVTGDGADDAPAIRIADVGIALGSRATPAARAAADVVVTDDRIETIVDAFVEGRAMWGSVRRALGILLGGNLGEIAFTLATTLFTGRSALNARQLLLVNLLTDMLPAMAIAARPPTDHPDRLLAEGPEASLGTALIRHLRLRAAVTTAAAAAAWTVARVTGTRGVPTRSPWSPWWPPSCSRRSRTRAVTRWWPWPRRVPGGAGRGGERAGAQPLLRQPARAPRPGRSRWRRRRGRCWCPSRCGAPPER
ncbi:HAD-IC family P-type ATPase [Streptomyces sp. INA 01156]